MKIVVKKIPLNKQRYQTEGDYWMDDEDVMQVRISCKTKEEFYTYLIHELVEAFLTLKRKIRWDAIDQFDMMSGLDDPGASKLAPYHKEHMFANKIETMFLKELNK